MTNKNKIKNLFWVIIIFIPIIGLGMSIILPDNYQEYRVVVQDLLINVGIFAPLGFILIQILQVIIAPVSHYVIGVVGGYIFGFFWGGIFNYIGRVIGHVCVFFISRKLGRKWMEKRVDKNIIERFDKIFSGSESNQKISIQSLILFFIYFLPLFPDDEISYIVGLSKMSFKMFLLANIFGQAGGAFSLALIGNGIHTKDPWFWILTIVTLIGFPIIWILLKKHQTKEK